MKPIPTILGAALSAGLAVAQATVASKLPVRELTAFKDGHAFVVRSGAAALGDDGRVVLDDLPAPLLGTFWSSVAAAGCRLRSVTAGSRPVAVERTAIALRELLEANVGAEVFVHETGDVRYRATIAGLPARAVPTERGDVVLLRTKEARRDTNAERIAADGTRLVPLKRIVDVTFVQEPNPRFVDEVEEPRLVLDVACAGQRPEAVPLSLAWVEKGFRWIPSYRVELDGEGRAKVRLQATLVNDLVDLEDATVRLVVGVPSFAAAGQLDPISLQQAVAQAYAQAPVLQQQFLSNAIMSQVVANAPAAPAAPAMDLDEPGRKEEDLYVFTVEGVSLRKGERMVLPIRAFEVAYDDVWKLDVTLTPPQESWHQLRDGTDELARLLAAPKVRHEVRLHNGIDAPLTTGPALLLRGGQVLAQGLITYTPPGRSCDVALTAAIDLLVEKTDQETGRTPNAVRWNGDSFLRVDLEGKVRITNRRDEAVKVEITRTVFGKLDRVGEGGASKQLNVHEDSAATDSLLGWRRYSWFWSMWSMVLNGVGQATWTVELEPGAVAEVSYSWHYFWR